MGNAIEDLFQLLFAGGLGLDPVADHLLLRPHMLDEALDALGQIGHGLGRGPAACAVIDGGGGRAATQAMANLAEGIQGLVQHMRSEQQMIRDWVEAQAAREKELKQVLDRLARERIS